MSMRATAGLLAGAGMLAAGLVAPASQAAADPGSTKVLAANVQAIALSPGRVHYVVKSGDSHNLHARSMAVRPGVVNVGPAQALGPVRPHDALSASAGQLVYGHKFRNHAGRTRDLVAVAWNHDSPGELSGTRASLIWQTGSPPMVGRWGYDVRHDRQFEIPPYAQDLSGSFLVFSPHDNSIRQRDLSAGGEVVLRRAGSQRIAAVAAHGRRWAAWVTDCANYYRLCTQTLTILDRATGRSASYVTRGTTSLDMSGGYLAFDAVPSAPSSRQLRVIRLGTRSVVAAGTLPEQPYGEGEFGQEVAIRHFDMEDETIGWIDRNQVGKVAQLGSFADAPFYLGNMIAPASFSPNGDGRGDVWSMAFPVSKALPSCTVTFYRGTTAVRIVSCVNTNGMATAVWNGRSGSGKVLPKGRYTYRINGRDADGWLRHYNGVLTQIRSYVDKTA